MVTGGAISSTTEANEWTLSLVLPLEDEVFNEPDDVELEFSSWCSTGRGSPDKVRTRLEGETASSETLRRSSPIPESLGFDINFRLCSRSHPRTTSAAKRLPPNVVQEVYSKTIKLALILLARFHRDNNNIALYVIVYIQYMLGTSRTIISKPRYKNHRKLLRIIPPQGKRT